MSTAEINYGPFGEPIAEVVYAIPVEVVAQATTAERPAEEPVSSSLAGLVELILKRRDQLEVLISEPTQQASLIPRFLAISLVGFVFYGAAMSLVFTSAGQWPRLAPIADLIAGRAGAAIAFEANPVGASSLTRWFDGSAPTLMAAYAIGLVAASGICLPSLYFYGLLAGVKMTMLDVVVHTLKAKATSAVALVGVLPIYAALGLGIVIFHVPEPLRDATFWLGLCLPFLAGLFGTYSLYRGFAGLASTIPAECRGIRAVFLERLVLSWGACYTAVTPIMIHTLWVLLAGK